MGVFFILFLVGIAIAVAQSSHRSSDAAWKAAAEHLRLRHTPGNMFTKPQLDGTVRGVAVRVEILVRQGGGSRSTMTVYSVAHPTPGPPVTFKRQHAASFLRQFVGRRDVVVGDPRFDDTIVVDAPHERAITDYLTPARRAAILSVFSAWRTVELTDQWLTVSTPGRARDAAQIVSTVNRMADTSRILSDHDAIDEALARQDDGELHAAAEALHQFNAAAAEPNVVTQMLEAEALVSAGEPVAAAEIVEEVTDRLPADPEVSRLTDYLAESEDPPIGKTAPPADPLVDLAQQAVIDDLFAETRYGVAIDAHYRAAYADREITWTGAVEQTRPYRSDADFGTDPGTKTTVAIGSVGSSRLMSNRVKAVVDLPDGADVERGDTITFRGTLQHVDRFTRTFFVRDAQIV